MYIADVQRMARLAVIRSRDQKPPLLPSFVRATKAWLDRNSMVAELADKDGVFSLMKREVHNKIVLVQLGKPFYCPMSTLTLEPVVLNGWAISGGATMSGAIWVYVQMKFLRSASCSLL